MVYIGHDENQQIAYDVCQFSIENKTSKPVKINSISSKTIIEYKREVDPLASTTFTYARFFVPFVNNYNDVAIFCDCDFLFLDDINKLYNLYNETYAVQVVKHQYYPPFKQTKMGNRVQTQYPRKNWSSLILWNCKHPKNKALTPTIINSASSKFLHRFEWLEDYEIGNLSYEWNWLVGATYPNHITPKALHYTDGGPWLSGCEETEYSSVWNTYKDLYLQDNLVKK